MSDAPIPSVQDLEEIVCFVASTMFQEAFGTSQAAKDDSLNVGVQMEMAGVPTWVLYARWSTKVPLSFLEDDKANAANRAALEVSAAKELLNVVAGQLKSKYASDHTLGLPALVDAQPGPAAPNTDTSTGSWLLRADGVNLMHIEVRAL